jgi:hypothetical protein
MKSHLILLFILLLGPAGWDFAARTQQASSPAGWQELELTVSFGETRRQFTLPGKFLESPRNSPANPPSLLLKCGPPRRPGGTPRFRVGAVVVGVPLKIHMVEPPERKGGTSYYPEVTVSYRLDDGKPIDDEWPPRYDKISAEFDKPIFKKMLRAHTILITLPDNDGREIRMQFDMPDAAAGPLTSAKVAEACGVADFKK